VKGDSWPIIAPLGTTKGAVHWLVLDVERLMACKPDERTFLLAAGLGHLQCDHAPMFTAHLMAYRAERGLGLVRGLLRPWSRVAWFSADRAALVALLDLERTLAALRSHADSGVVWMPRPPAVVLREQALHDFDKSAVMVRVRLLQRRGEFTLTPDRKDGKGANPEAAAAEPDRAADGQPGESGDGDPYRNAAPEGNPPPSADEELASALANAWSLARCDQRLTRRLGLL